MEDQSSKKRFFLLPILKSVSQIGIRLIKLLLLTFFVFAVLNLLCVLVALWRYIPCEKTLANNTSFIACCVVSVLFMLLTLFLTYKHLMKDSFRTIYIYLSPFFFQVAAKIVDGVQTGVLNMENPHVEKILDSKKILSDVYGKYTPSILKRIVNIVISQIPFADIILANKAKLATTERGEASQILYGAIDGYIINNILFRNGLKWIYLLSLNIIIQTILIILIK